MVSSSPCLRVRCLLWSLCRHFKVTAARRGVRINRITNPTFCSLGRNALPPASGTTLMVVAAGQLPAAEAKLQALRDAGAHATVLVAMDPLSRSMWCTSADLLAGRAVQDGPPGSEPLTALMDWCVKAQAPMVVVPVSCVRARREGAGVTAWLVRQAVAVLAEGCEDRPAVKVTAVVAAEADDAELCMPWLPEPLSRALTDTAWSKVSLLVD